MSSQALVCLARPSAARSPAAVLRPVCVESVVLISVCMCRVLPWLLLLCVWLAQHFFQFFKSLVGQEVIVELKNDLKLRGILHSVDQYLNIKLSNLTVDNAQQHPHLVSGSMQARNQMEVEAESITSSVSSFSRFLARCCAAYCCAIRRR